MGPRIAVVGFAVLTAAFGLNFAAGQFFAPLGREEGWSVAALSVAAALNTAVAGLIQPMAGRLIDRVGARSVITVAVGLLAVSYMLLAVVRELWQFYVVYGLLAGIGFGSASSMAVSVLISHWYEQRRSTVLARTFMGINAGQLTLLPLGGALIAGAGPRTAYVVLGLLVLVTVVPLAAFGLRSRPADVGQQADGGRGARVAATGPEATFAEAVRDRDWWLLTVAFGINGATLYLTLLHLPRLAVDLGGGLATGGALIAVAAAASAISMLVHSALAARRDKRWLIVELFALRAVALLLAAAADSVADLYVAAVVFGVASFPVIPLITGSISQRFGTRAIGAVLGTTFVVHQVGAGLGVLGAGLVRDAAGSYRPALVAGAVALGLGAWLVACVRAEGADAPGAHPPRLFHLTRRPERFRMSTNETTTASTAVKHRRVDVDGVEIFYREAGDPTNPTLLLLHGLPTSSRMFRNLIPALADRFHLVAPDYPGFGLSAFPPASTFEYSFANLTKVVERFIDVIGLDSFSVYIQDYGAPIGLTIASTQPDRVRAIVSQSGNAYMEGFTPFWEPLFAYATDRTPENEAKVTPLLTAEANVWQWTHGTRDPEHIDPDLAVLDTLGFDRPGNREVQLDLFYDYRLNLDKYPDFQQYFRDRQPPTLLVWGKNDEIFGPDGARAFLNDLPDAELHLLDTGHFALEEEGDFIAARIREFLTEHAA